MHIARLLIETKSGLLRKVRENNCKFWGRESRSRVGDSGPQTVAGRVAEPVVNPGTPVTYCPVDMNCVRKVEMELKNPHGF